jgi:hypothetical protein
VSHKLNDNAFGCILHLVCLLLNVKLCMPSLGSMERIRAKEMYESETRRAKEKTDVNEATIEPKV